MSALAARQNFYRVVERMPEDTVVTFHDVSWEEYEDLLERVGEARGLRISYGEGTMQVVTFSTEHEAYSEFISGMMSMLSVRLRINICFFGSSTIRKKQRRKGKEPDKCFYVQTAPLLGNRQKLDFEKDPPPDVAVEIDIHHASRDKFTIYAGLGVPEVWLYDGKQLTIHLLRGSRYVKATASQALPMLTSAVLTEFLTRMREDGEFQAMLAFEEWLQAQPQ
jgi:Uma2 family endonuclease